MKEQLYLTFSLGQQKYSIDSIYLEEMLPLPEITLLPTASKDIIGILNLRGNIVPILDLNVSLGHTPRPYRTTDSIIVLKQSQLIIGLVVSNIGDLETRQTIDVDVSDSRLQAQRAEAQRKQIISGKILSTETADSEQEANPCWLLNEPEQWLRYVEIQQLISIAGIVEENPAALPKEFANAETTIFCPQATPEERAIFQQRAFSLRQQIKNDQAATVSTLAIVTIGQMYLGIDLSVIKEFTDIQTVVPIPCCPPYIVGNMNLRGDILTLVDLGKCLSRSSDANAPLNSRSPLEAFKVMVIEVEQYVLGILVDKVLEAMFPLSQQDSVVPSTMAIEEIDPRYFQGEFPYRDTTVSILNLPKILAESDVIINEVVR